MIHKEVHACAHFLTLFVSSMFVTIAAVDDISSLSQLPQPSENIIYVFDIDNTLIRPTTVRTRHDQYGSVQWWAYNSQLITSGHNTKFTSTTQLDTTYTQFLIHEMEPETVESRTADILRNIQQYAPIYAITSRYENCKNATHAQLTTVGIQMSDDNGTECKLDAADGTRESNEEKPLYSRGIVFAGDYPGKKGDALIRLLKHQYGYIPHNKHIVFVDDKKSPIGKLSPAAKVEKACNDNNIPCTALRYTACDKYIKQFFHNGEMP